MGLIRALFGRGQSGEKESRYSDIGNLGAVCPYCDAPLDKKPGAKAKCPHCDEYIYVKKRPLDMERVLVTADQREILEQEWSERHIRRQWGPDWVEAYDEAVVALERQFGFKPPLADVYWRVLDQMVFSQTMEGERWNLFHEALYILRQLRMKGELDTVENTLLRAEPTPAVADELRKTLSEKARLAKKEGDWESVARHLERYVQYADKWRQHCLDLVNQEPPPLTDSDRKLLEKARER
jgi:hypothetical protein